MNILECTATCQICEREYSQDVNLIPRILTGCGHTLCQECATKIVGSETLICPYDRLKTHVKDGDVGNLKKNWTILQMIEEGSFKKRQRRAEKKGKKERMNNGRCDENDAHQASSFCKQCDADLSSRKTLLFNKPISAEECPIHPGELAEFVCKVEMCQKMQSRLMCHVCFREGTSHQGHGYVALQTENMEMRTKMLNSLKVAEEKEVAIHKNIEGIDSVIATYSLDGTAFRDKYLQVKMFRFFEKDKDELIVDAMRKAVDARKETLRFRISDQKTNLDWIRKNKGAIERLQTMPSAKLVDQRFQVDLAIANIENAPVKHPKCLMVCSMCEVHVRTLNPLMVEMKPAYRLEIRESYHNQVKEFLKEHSSVISPKTCMQRYKNNFFRLIERAEDTKLYSEGLSLILVVDPFDGDQDRQFVALELLENAPAYEKIVVGLNPFNYHGPVTTFINKLKEAQKKDSRIQYLYINNGDEDIEKIVDMAMSR
ncbi:unnamed protein product [Caenorhabditis sp. 36 PRJEB53466]|nr:unnamed protein product [Caenorhabditis sp. 36 PRJEB53466]